MKILAIETTDISGSLAAADWKTDPAETPEQNKFNWPSFCFDLLPLTEGQRSAQSLAPSINKILASSGWDIADLEYIAVGTGPGSFTGLRVGVTTAKILAWALKTKIIGINTLESMSWNIPRDSDDRILSCAVDAQRGEVAVQRFFLPADPQKSPFSIDPQYTVMPIKKWLEIENNNHDSKTAEYEKNTENENDINSKLIYQKIKEAETRGLMFCSPVLTKWQDKIDPYVRKFFVSPEFWHPTAIGVLKAACFRAAQGKTDDVWSILPEYSRLSAAQERLLAQKSNKAL